jgi:hypothetical protein
VQYRKRLIIQGPNSRALVAQLPALVAQLPALVAQTGTGGAVTGTGGAVCKGATPSVEQPGGRGFKPRPAILARLGNKYLLKSLMMSTLHSASVLDKLP